MPAAIDVRHIVKKFGRREPWFLAWRSAEA
jgi:hypothetical protein